MRAGGLDRERHAVEPAADLGDGRELRGRDREVGLAAPRLDEELHRVGRLDGTRIGARIRQTERPERHHLLAIDGEALAAGGEHANVRAGIDDLAVDHLLTELDQEIDRS